MKLKEILNIAPDQDEYIITHKKVKLSMDIVDTEAESLEDEEDE